LERLKEEFARLNAETSNGMTHTVALGYLMFDKCARTAARAE
jgi:hypothetical protein